ncbi:hypothetical protein AB6A40_006603 [Gnathostoma spinigerum]|uniref:General transcription factor IIH subunit 4 n=1 Tax=Gnathostoma spinigerum TaxID=75299 RepID=A0ABD6ERI5_9BILA
MNCLGDRPLLEFLTTLSDIELERLYSSPAAAFVVFRVLPDIAQQALLRLIWHVDGVDNSCWRSWISEEKYHLLGNFVEILRKLRIVDGVMEETVTLNPIYRHSYLTAIKLGMYRASKFTAVTELDEKNRKAANKDVGRKAVERWECILHYLALPSQKSEQGVSGLTKQLFKVAGLTSDANAQGDIEITSAGFQFLLLNRAEQIWSYLLHYFRMEQQMGSDVVAQLDLLLRLTLCVQSRYSPKSSVAVPADDDHEKDRSHQICAYLIDSAWPDVLKNFLLHLRELGLIFIRKRKDGFFFITPLFQYLTEASTAHETKTEDNNRNGYIIVETNFRVYAYTESSLQLAILSTFTEMTYRFNDMCVGVLSREAVRRALQVGITANQIIAFLRANAHPETIAAAVASGGAIQCVPVTVADQIRLWEDERKRLTFREATMYSTFESEAEYVGVKGFAKAEGILLWSDDIQRLVVVTEEGHNSVKAWWKRNKPAVSS